uniref:RGS domain-containing protein n=1 Tax=Elaeophora elaphi TaxID=1147741 RepID=A0A158Q8D6_9BILA
MASTLTAMYRAIASLKYVTLLGFFGNNCEPQPSTQRIFPRSALVYTLNETLHDATALAYFIQFMEGIGQLNLIKFWLHVESFRCSGLAAKMNDGALITMIKNDAVRIYSKYISEDAPCSINITDQLRKVVLERINVKNGSFDPCCFSEAQSFVFNVMENRYFKEFENSVYYAKHRIDVISSGAITIRDVMLCQPLLCAFVEYMENEDDGKLVEFIISAESFAEQLPLAQSDEQAVEDAMIIYNRYFSMQATEPLKFDSKTRIQIESDICLGSGRPSPNCFETARLKALRILEQNYLKRFSASPAFVKYLQKLMAQVENNVELPNPNMRRRTYGTSSDQSSDTNISTSLFDKATYRSLTHLDPSLPATSLPLNREEYETGSQPDSSNSSGTNVPRIARPRASVSLATIDDMGRYRPMYDNSYSISENKGNTRRKLKSKLDKYLHYSMKKEAEVADQVAQLIVADVHNMVSAGSSLRLPDL